MGIERNLEGAALHNPKAEEEELNGEEDEAVCLLHFNRRPQEMHDKLANGQALSACRKALEDEGYNWKLSGGTTIFVHPWQYDAVMRALAGRTQSHQDIVVTSSMEYLVEETLSGIGK